jgi:hypothetical protein
MDIDMEEAPWRRAGCSKIENQKISQSCYVCAEIHLRENRVSVCIACKEKSTTTLKPVLGAKAEAVAATAAARTKALVDMMVSEN